MDKKGYQVIFVIVGLITFIAGVYANKYYSQKSEERIIAALRDAINSIKGGKDISRLSTEQQNRIKQLEEEINLIHSIS